MENLDQFGNIDIAEAKAILADIDTLVSTLKGLPAQMQSSTMKEACEAELQKVLAPMVIIKASLDLIVDQM